MNLGVFEHGWWSAACHALGARYRALPIARHSSGNVYAADLSARAANGRRVVEALAGCDARLLVDLGGVGLNLVPDSTADQQFKLAHECAGRTLFSHFIDPISTSFQGLPWEVVWPCLKSGTWIKGVWDRAQAVELQRFGVPNVVHLPMAAPDRAYDAAPVDPGACRPVISFVGGQNTSYFRSNAGVATGSLLAGTLAQAVRSDMPGAQFLDAYYDLFGLDQSFDPSAPLGVQARQTAAYFNAKLYHHAALCIRNRDRFVLFLKRKLGDAFRLYGPGWDAAYGISAEPPLPTFAEYLDHFRHTAINLNLVNGNAETGLNMRHFEITAAGGFLLCMDQPELKGCFEPGKECAVFQNEQDLIEKVRYYLGRPDERAAIAQAGQRRTLSEHLYSHRLAALLRAVGLPPQVPVASGTRRSLVTSTLP
jgi:hypothetical protein